MRERFIVIEGLDGSGKSTQVNLLAKRLRRSEAKKRFKHTGVITTVEPTSDRIGKLIRLVLEHRWICPPDALQLLFAADRADHLGKKIKPAIANGKMIISDRYFFSTIGYGAPANSRAWLKQLNKNFPTPDITFFIAVFPKECMRRIRKRKSTKTIFEKQKQLEQVWKNYTLLAKEYPRVHIVDGMRSPEEISDEIYDVLSHGEK